MPVDCSGSPWRHEIERIEIPVGDLTFQARACGPEDGPLVLLLHGFPETSYAFRSQLVALGALGLRAVAPDQRGYSPQARPVDVSEYAVGTLAGDVLAMADALGADRFDLVGHDWGGIVAWIVATRSPGRVRTLTVLSTPHFAALSASRASNPDQAQRSSYFADLAADGAEVRLLANDAERLRHIYSDLPSDAVAEYMRALGNRDALRGALAWYGAAFGRSATTTKTEPPTSPDGPAESAEPATAPSDAASASPPPALRPVTVPTLYVWSTEDGAFGRDAAEATRRYVTGPYRFEVLEGVDHWIAERVPDRVSRLLAEHILTAGKDAESPIPADSSHR
ncbi:MAG: alpha/beta hydrolase [Candidatus Eisenbacteria bacterium]|uniref:Alpha/beta hydrolase n=1 Tax=Eiseniibacteriota bacterium TaxID=2212470 RepID=A0A956M4S9_UNCEI|nr:alpha/beta hydrolase [Candidatus Eisenbacteria bacterium]